MARTAVSSILGKSRMQAALDIRMAIGTRHRNLLTTTALSWRAIMQRFSFAFLLSLSVGLLVVGHNRPTFVQTVRLHAIDGMAGVMDVLSRPMAAIDGLSLRIQTYRTLLQDNERLRTENADLVRWRNTALVLGNENKELRGLLRYKAEPAFSYISARVIADTGGSFVRSLVVTAGSLDGVREGMAAVTGEGLVGRVVEVGAWTSRLLLLTDMNARIPVMIVGTGEHAILAGDNSPQPRLLYLSQESDVRVGSRVVTSGHGGVFPPNIPVGVVASVHDGAFDVAPFASLRRINQIRLIDFDLAGGGVNVMASGLGKPAGR